ncbi:MAG: hypothetical protein M0Z46_10475 [Actinomycetota bacterium]|jgi:hypothetical protein|nr:hypothetical protein [Actinomycetota bacterium]
MPAPAAPSGTTTTTAPPTSGAAKTYTQFTWAALVLRMAGLPPTKLNVEKIVRWMANEEPPKTWYNRNNPLNVGTGTHPNGTGSFRSLWTAAHYTAKALEGSNYAAVRSNLAHTGSLTQFSAAVVASPWASSHYGGTPQKIARTPIPTPRTVKGFGTGREGTAGGVVPTGTTPTCVIQFPGVAGAGAFCILNKSQAHRIAGGLLVVAGGLVMLVGVGMLAAFGFGSSAAQRQLRRAGIGGSPSAQPPTGPAPSTTSSSTSSTPAPETQAQRNRRQVEALPPDVRDEARRRREAYGLQASSAPARPAPTRPEPAERRPRAQATSTRSTGSGQPSRRPKRPHGRTTGLGPRARARRR